MRSAKTAARAKQTRIRRLQEKCNRLIWQAERMSELRAELRSRESALHKDSLEHAAKMAERTADMRHAYQAIEARVDRLWELQGPADLIAAGALGKLEELIKAVESANA